MWRTPEKAVNLYVNSFLGNVRKKMCYHSTDLNLDLLTKKGHKWIFHFQFIPILLPVDLSLSITTNYVQKCLLTFQTPWTLILKTLKLIICCWCFQPHNDSSWAVVCQLCLELWPKKPNILFDLWPPKTNQLQDGQKQTSDENLIKIHSWLIELICSNTNKKN